jgi:hypothetical protein
MHRKGKIYFAIKDVSVAGGHIGTTWPYNRSAGDAHDAPSNNITLVDYDLSATIKPKRPEGLTVQRINETPKINSLGQVSPRTLQAGS